MSCNKSERCGADAGGTESGEGKKFPCPDCSYCQWCSDDRCRLCRCTGKRARKLSMAEQIALYESVNGEG